LGGLVGAAAVLPLLALTLARVPLFDPAPAGDLLAQAAIFGGIPALLTAGGIARLVAHRAAERGTSMGAGIARGATAMALCGAALAVVTVVAQPGSPEDPRGWALVAATGVPAGILAGVAIALVAITRQRRFEART
jgi:hypothetical protein